MSGSEERESVGVLVVVLEVMWDGSRGWSVAAVMDDGWRDGGAKGGRCQLPCFAGSHYGAAAAREIQNNID